MSIGAWLRRAIEDALPWYDQVEEREHAQQAAAAEQRATEELARNARVRAAYQDMGNRVDRRPRPRQGRRS